jgi:hypothetical protein
VGILRERPTDVPADIKSELAKFGVVDPEGFDQALPGIDKELRRGKVKGGEEAASLKEYRLRSSMIPFTAETLRQPGEKNLLVQHNIRARGLLHADEMGGLPAPSLAISRKEHPAEGFGEITLLADKAMVDPAAGTPVFGSDIYSPRYPQASYEVAAKPAQKLREQLQPFAEKTDGYLDDLEEQLREGPQQALRTARLKSALQLAWLTEKGEAIDPPDGTQDDRAKLYEYRDAIEAKVKQLGEADFEAWAESKLGQAIKGRRIFKGYTASGNRRYIPYTLENVLKQLTKKIRQGEDFNYGLGTARAAGSQKFRSIEQIQKARERITSPAEFQKLKDEMDERFTALTAKLAEYSTSDRVTENLAYAIGDSYKRGRSIRSELKTSLFENVPDDLVKEVGDFAADLLAMPTEYFEAKPQRVVGIHEFKAAVVPTTTSEAVRAVLKKHGVDVHTYDPAKEGDRQRAITEASEAKQILFQPGGGDGTERGYTEFVQQGVDRIARVVLRPNADLSTFLHESAHIFLDMFQQLAERPDTPARVREDFEATRKWMGLKEGERIQEEHHEKWADTFEGYLKNGKAPTSALRRVFYRFRLWLSAIYRGLSGISKTQHLSPEIQGVFDRLLATDEELERAEQRMGLNEPLWKSPSEAGLSPEAFAEYLKSKEDAVSNAARAGDIRALKDRERETKAWWKEQQTALEHQLEDEYEQLPGRKAQLILRGKEAPLAGESPLATMAKVPLPLDRDRVVAVVGEEGAKKLLTSKKNGMDPDDVARMVGFETGEAMLKAVVAVPEKKGWVKETAAQRMREKYPDILQERDELTATVEKALHSDFTAESLYRELQLLRTKAGALMEYREERLGTPPPPMEAIRRAADQMAADTEVGKLTPGRALQAERAAADRALSHAAAGEYAQAAVAKQAQLLNMFLWRSLTEAREERDSLLDLAGDLRKDKARAKAGKANPAFRDGIDRLLEAVGLRPPDPNAGDRKTLDQAVQAMDDGGTSVLFELEPLQALLANPRDWRTLKVSEMRNLLAALKNIRAASSATTKAMLDDKHIEHEDAVAAIVGEAAANRKERKPLASSTGAENLLQKAWNVLDAFGAGWLQPATLVRWLSGDDPTSMTYRLLFQPLVDAYAKEADILKNVVEPITEAFKAIPESVQKRFTERIDGKALFPNHRHEKDIKPPSRRWEILVMGLNAGNEENLQRLLEGRGITVEQLQNALGMLSREEVAWINKVGATFETLWEPSKQLEEKLSGLAPKKVEGKPFSFDITVPLADGKGSVKESATITGHYFPAVYDRRVENIVGERQAMNVGELTTPGYVRPFTPHSHLKRRAENFSGVIALDPSVIYAHLAQVAHDLAYREPIQSVGSLIMDPEVQTALKRHLSDEKAKVFLRWVQDVGTQRGAQVDSHLPTVNRFMRQLKSNSSLAVLGWSTRIFMGDWANLAANAIHLQPKFWWGGLRESTLDFEAADALVMEKSGFMRARRGQVIHEFRNHLAAVTKSQAKALKAMRWFKEHAFALVEWTDKVTSRPLWIGAFRQAQAEGMSEHDAIQFADDKVMKAFPTSSPLFQAAWLRDRGALGFLTQFFGYFSTVYNQERDAVEQVFQAVGIKEKAKSAARAGGTLLALWLTTGVLGELLTGRGPDPSDGDNEYERWFNWFKRQLALAPLRSIPLPIANTVESLALHKRASVRAPPAFQLLEGLGRAAQLAMQDEKGDQALLQLAKTMGMTLGIPLSPFALQGGYAASLLSGENPPEGPGDVVHGALYGPPPPSR